MNELKEEIGVSNAKLTCLAKIKERKSGIEFFLVEIPKKSERYP